MQYLAMHEQSQDASTASSADVGVQAALKRLQLDYVDIVFAHRPDIFTPIEETVRAFNFVIEQGWAFYWGTSEWTAQQLTEVQS